MLIVRSLAATSIEFPLTSAPSNVVVPEVLAIVTLSVPTTVVFTAVMDEGGLEKPNCPSMLKPAPFVPIAARMADIPADLSDVNPNVPELYRTKAV